MKASDKSPSSETDQKLPQRVFAPNLGTTITAVI